MRKVLFVATVTSHINAFHIPYLKYFKENGYEVHVASNGDTKIEYCDKHYNLPFERFPFKMSNLKTYKELKRIIDDNQYEIIHCHTPVGGVLTRLAAKKARKKGTRVIYTAHGFHFFKGAPLLNWLIYYPIEKWLSKYTDTLITINQEDYDRAKKHFKAKKIELVHGVGVDEEKFNFTMTDEEKKKFREELGVKENDFVITIVGELNKNKNQIMAIETIRKLVKQYDNIKLLLVGKGPLRDFYENKIMEYNLKDKVVLLGRRDDVPKILKVSDLLLSLSYREGLPVNVMEAMITGLPIIATNCRGNRDLIENGKNGYIVSNNIEQFYKQIKELIDNKNKREEYGNHSKDMVYEYTIENVMVEMKNIYHERIVK